MRRRSKAAACICIRRSAIWRASAFRAAGRRDARPRAALPELTALAQSEYADLPLRVLGPCESQILKIAGRYRWRMAVKCRWNARTRELLWRTVQKYLAVREYHSVALSIDPRFESAL